MFTGHLLLYALLIQYKIDHHVCLRINVLFMDG